MSDSYSYENRVCLVTGGASGIGEALVGKLLKKKAIVYALDWNEKALKELEGKYSKETLLCVKPLDVRDAAQVEYIIKNVFEEQGRLDFLFNNAGITLIRETHKIAVEDWRKVLDVNLKGTIYGIHAAYPLMIEQGFGHIVNTASTAAITGYPTSAHYAASKAAILSLSHSLSYEAKVFGVSVTAVCPGYVNTSIFAENSLPEVNRDSLLGDLPFKALTPEEVVDVILKGVLRKKSQITISFPAKFYSFLSKAFPKVLDSTFKKLIEDYHKARTSKS